MIESFPPNYTMREAQKDLIEKIGEAVKSGYPNIIVCAPVGIGKSHVAVTFARHFGSSSIITHQKVLQDQYCKSFPFISSLKGRQNYPCAMQPGSSCAEGICSWKGIDGKKEWCRYKPKADEFEQAPSGALIAPPDICEYYEAKYSAKLSKHAIYNYPSYYHAVRSGKLEKNCTIADEAHEIERTLADYSSVSLSKNDLKMIGADMPNLTFEHVTDVITRMADHASEVIRNATMGDGILKYRSLNNQCRTVLYEGHKSPNNMVFEIRDGYLFVGIINVSNLAKRMFAGKPNLFMSGTIHGEMFASAMGMDSRDWIYIEVKKHPFPLQNRKMKFINAVQLNERTEPKDYEIAYSTVSRLLANHPNEKGLVLCTSKSQCDKIQQRIKNRKVIVAYGANREKAVKSHIESVDPSVLVSPGMWSGLDLSGDLSRFQIILKVPYLPMSDIRTTKQPHIWYRYQALVRFLQGCGRSVRDPQDHAITYVVDSSIVGMLRTMRKYIPTAYLDAIDSA